MVLANIFKINLNGKTISQKPTWAGNLWTRNKVLLLKDSYICSFASTIMSIVCYILSRGHIWHVDCGCQWWTYKLRPVAPEIQHLWTARQQVGCHFDFHSRFPLSSTCNCSGCGYKSSGLDTLQLLCERERYVTQQNPHDSKSGSFSLFNLLNLLF